MLRWLRLWKRYRELKEAIQESSAPVTFTIPFSRYGILSEIHAAGRIITEEHTANGTEITAMITAEDVERLVRKHGAGIVSRTGEAGGKQEDQGSAVSPGIQGIRKS